MRVLALLATFVAATLATNDVDHVKQVIRSWNPDRPLRIIEAPVLEDEEHSSYHDEDSHGRSKRSVPFSQLASIPSTDCQTPGYTGQFCTDPICFETNNKMPTGAPTDGQGAPIDAAQLLNCTQQHVILVDDTMNNIIIEVQTENNVNPQFTLIAMDGTVPKFTQIMKQDPTHYEVLYGYLVPGKYVVVPSADLLATYCNLNVKANTNLYLVGGFASGNYDYVRDDYPKAFTYTNTPNVFVAHVNNNTFPGTLKAVSFVGGSNVVGTPGLFRTRYGCNYEYFLKEGFQCPSFTENYFYQVEGVTFNGHQFRRIGTFVCYPPPVTTTTTAPSTTPAGPVSRCHNGGVLIKNLDGSTYCFCQGLWTGDTCSAITCLNGGTVTADNTCMCPDSYSGDHCQNIFCQDDQGDGFDTNHPTMTLVVRTRSQLKDVVTQVLNATVNAVNSLSYDPTYIQQFILVMFNNNQIVSNGRYTSMNDMVNALTGGIALAGSAGGCTDSLFSAISTALAMYPTNKSPMYVITDATPGDVDQADTALIQESFWRVPITVVFVPPGPTAPNCFLSPEDSGYRALDNLAKKSQGVILYVNNRTTVQDLVYNHMIATIYRTQLLLSNDLAICNNQNLYKTISIDATLQQISIVATGSNLKLIFTDPLGNHPDAIVVYADGSNSIWTLQTPDKGNWFVTFISDQPTGPCNFKIYQMVKRSGVGPSQTQDLFWAFTRGIDGDGELVQPVVGFATAVTAHLTNYFPYGIAYSALTIYASRNGVQTEVYASNGVWRDGCTYNFYFTPFTCQVPEETLYFNFYARDSVGSAIQRAGVMSCMLFQPTQFPPTECQNSGVMNPANTTCYCPPEYTGTYCEKIVCFNGGTPQGQVCACPIGWTGIYCGLPQCLEKGPEPEFIRNYVDMIFAVELTSQGFAQIQSLNMHFSDLIRDIQSQDSKWIGQFVLVGYNSTWGDVIHVSPAGNVGGLIKALNTLASKEPTDKGCTVQLYHALDMAVRRRVTAAGSYIQIFQTSPADETDSGGWNEMYQYSRELFLVINGFLAFSPRNAGGFYCNATQDKFQLLFDLSGGSTGNVYPTQPGNVDDLVRVIPLQYSSGIVYAKWQTDCTAPMQVYFPVDAYAQTIQLNVIGLQNTAHVFDSNGVEAEIFPLMHDGYSNWDIWEIRKPCDDRWVEAGQYCILLELDAKPWPVARNYCTTAGGYLVDDMTSDKHGFLVQAGTTFKYWIGLYNNGSGYLWDRGELIAPQPLSQDQQQFWVGGGAAPAYDPTKQCVFFDPTQRDGNTWTLDSCSMVRPFACQKHRYDQTNPPTDISTDDLAAGKWTVNITSQNNGSFFGCYVEVRVQSSLQILTGFTQDMSFDYPSNDPIADSPNNMLMTYIHTLDNEHRFPILTHALLWDAYNGTFYDAGTYQYRGGCSWPWITQNFACPNGGETMNEFGIAHIGEDEFGNTFQRITFGHCSPQVLTCGNGGFRVNGTCVCDEYWMGKYCNIPMCVNGGFLDSTERFCHCPPGFDGNNCQFDRCFNKVPFNFNINSRTMYVIIEATIQNQAALNQLATNFSSIVNNAMGQHPGWFYYYGLIAYNSSGVTFSSFIYTDPTPLQMAIGIIASNLVDPGTCNTPIFGALNFALQQNGLTNPDSQILLVTASGPSDVGVRHESAEYLAYSEAALHWLYQTSGACGPQPPGDSLPHLVRLAYASNGNAVFLTPSTLSQFLFAYLPTRFMSSTLTNPTEHSNFTCVGASWVVEVDSFTTSVYVTSSAMLGSIGVKDPNNQIRQADILFSQDQTKLYKIDTKLPGLYTIGLSSVGACYASVYSVGGMTVYNYFSQPTVNDTTAAHIDGTKRSPVAGASNVAVFHLDMSSAMGTLQYVEMYDVNHQNCDNDFIAVLVYGMDVNNQGFRRQMIAYCLNGSLPTNAPATTGTPGITMSTQTTIPVTSATPATTGTTGTTVTQAPITTNTPAITQAPASPTPPSGPAVMQFDVVFLIDVSKSAAALYDDMSKFISTLMLTYTVGLNYARVGLIPVFGDGSFGSITVAGFSTLTSQTMLNQYLVQIKNVYGDFDDQGQYLGAALSAANNTQYMTEDNGYRHNLNNHLLVYITATSAFSDGPSTAGILQNNYYGVITIGYQGGVTDTATMQTLAGGAACSFTAADFASLNSVVLPAVQKLILAAGTNGGKYCGNGN